MNELDINVSMLNILIEQRDALKAELSEKTDAFINETKQLKESLKHIEETEEITRKNIVELMNNESLNEIKKDEFIITKSCRQTKVINDKNILFDYIKLNAERVSEVCGVEKDSLINIFKPSYEITDTKTLNNIIDTYEKIEGVMLDGTNIKSNEYITFKKLK